MFDNNRNGLYNGSSTSGYDGQFRNQLYSSGPYDNCIYSNESTGGVVYKNNNEVFPGWQNYNGESVNCYQLQKKHRNEEIDMSFVGIISCKDGFIGFGDSKCTFFDCYNVPYQSTIHPWVQKVFSNDKFLMVSFGLNVISQGMQSIPLENDINANISRFDTPIEFCESFSWYLNSLNIKQGFDFIFGYVDKFNKKQTIIHYFVSNEGILIRNKITGAGYLTNTVPIYSEKFDSFINQCGFDYNKLSELLVPRLESIVNEVDNDDNVIYNPVGGDIQIKKLNIE